MIPNRPIRFRFSARKGLAAIHWMAQQIPGIDLHTVVKSCYFADKRMLNEQCQPIFGATYRAMRFGPVPLELYEMAKGEPIWLAELGIHSYPWRLDGFRIVETSNTSPDMTVFSEDELEILQSSLNLSRSLSFDARTAATHGPDWQSANLGIMRYEDMLDDTDDKPAKVEYLAESAQYMRL